MKDQTFGEYERIATRSRFGGDIERSVAFCGAVWRSEAKLERGGTAMRLSRRAKLAAVLVAVAVCSAVAAVAVSRAVADQGGPPVQHSGTKASGFLTASGSKLINWGLATDPNDVLLTPGTSFVPVPSMSVTVHVGATTARATIVAQFSSESACYNSTSVFQYCSIDMTANGAAMSPGDGLGDAYDSTDPNAPVGSFTGWKDLSNTRSIVVGPGNYTIQVVAATTDSSSSTTFWIGERTLNVEVYK